MTTDPQPTFAPQSLDETAAVLKKASASGTRLLIRGGGTHQGLGGRVAHDATLSTDNLHRVVDWQPEDLTVVVESGVGVADLEARLAEAGQTAVLPEVPGEATVGGVVAAGVSGWRRLRYGPTRDRVLQVRIVTGDGRIVKGGGTVVKNVTGYDLPRLATGSLGGLGIIAELCLKLWPLPPATATVTVNDAERALAVAHRPLSLIVDNRHTLVMLGGTPAEVDAQAATLDGETKEGLNWPPILEAEGDEATWSLRVPPPHLSAALDRLDGWPYQASAGVGEAVFVSSATTTEGLLDLRRWCEARGGALVLTSAPDHLYQAVDPWGAPPASLALQRRVVARFDPVRIVNPGRLPGGL